MSEAHTLNMRSSADGLLYVPKARTTIENHCTQTARSSCVGCSWRVHIIGYLAVKKANILVNTLLLKIFIAKYCHL